jgi:hypothetical protein
VPTNGLGEVPSVLADAGRVGVESGLLDVPRRQMPLGGLHGRVEQSLGLVEARQATLLLSHLASAADVRRPAVLSLVDLARPFEGGRSIGVLGLPGEPLGLGEETVGLARLA